MAAKINALLILDSEISEIAGTSDLDDRGESELRRREARLRAARASLADLIEAALEFFDAQEALDNHELMGPNADDHGKLMRQRNQARRELATALARVGAA